MKNEIINILKVLFLGEAGFKGNIPKKYSKLKMANFSNKEKLDYFLDIGNIGKIFEKIN